MYFNGHHHVPHRRWEKYGGVWGGQQWRKGERLSRRMATGRRSSVGNRCRVAMGGREERGWRGGEEEGMEGGKVARWGGRKGGGQREDGGEGGGRRKGNNLNNICI
jgi:hypothetical protein